MIALCVLKIRTVWGLLMSNGATVLRSRLRNHRARPLQIAFAMLDILEKTVARVYHVQLAHTKLPLAVENVSTVV